MATEVAINFYKSLFRQSDRHIKHRVVAAALYEAIRVVREDDYSDILN